MPRNKKKIFSRGRAKNITNRCVISNLFMEEDINEAGNSFLIWISSTFLMVSWLSDVQIKLNMSRSILSDKFEVIQTTTNKFHRIDFIRSKTPQRERWSFNQRDKINWPSLIVRWDINRRMEIEFGQRPFEKGLESLLCMSMNPIILMFFKSFFSWMMIFEWILFQKGPSKGKNEKNKFRFFSLRCFQKLTYVVYFMI